MMKSGSKIHFLSDPAHDNATIPADGARRSGDDCARRPARNTIQDSAATAAPSVATIPGSAYSDPSQDYDDEVVVTVELPGLQVHAPWPGLHGACEGCGAPSVSGLGSGPTECEHCHRQIAGGEGGARQKPLAKGKKGSGVAAPGKEGVVAVTSSREIALGEERAKALAWAGATMLATSLLLLLLLLIAWRGINFSLVAVLSPWLGVYVPIPLGILNGSWSMHCAKRGHIRHHSTGSCASRGGLCGTDWGCSGPSCAVNLGLDLGLLITALLAALPAGASAEGCGYDCFVLLCFPCAPGGGVGMAVAMVMTTLGLATAAGFKMWMMAPALLTRQSRQESFLPW